MDEKNLLNRIKKGEESAFEYLFMSYYQPLVVFSVKFVNDMDLARDIVQEVIVNFLEKHRQIDIHTSLKAHLYQSVKNRCLNHLKREQIVRNHHSNIFVDKKTEEEKFYDLMEETELEQKIFQVISSLPPQCQKIFEMSRFQGKSNQDISEELSISKRTVETQISNALKKLRQKLAGYLTSALLVFCIFIYTLLSW